MKFQLPKTLKPFVFVALSWPILLWASFLVFGVIIDTMPSDMALDAKRKSLGKLKEIRPLMIGPIPLLLAFAAHSLPGTLALILAPFKPVKRLLVVAGYIVLAAPTFVLFGFFLSALFPSIVKIWADQ